MPPTVIRVAACLPLLSACGFVEDVRRTSFQLPDLPFFVRRGTQLVHEQAPLDQDVDLTTVSAVEGASRLDDVRIEGIGVEVRANELGVGIEQLRFVVAPVSLESQAVFATVSDIAADQAEWPEVEVNEQGEAHLIEFISNVRDRFTVQASITFDILEGESRKAAGDLDLWLRITASGAIRQ